MNTFCMRVLVTFTITSIVINTIVFWYYRYARRLDRRAVSQKIADDIGQYAKRHRGPTKNITIEEYMLEEARWIALYHGDPRHAWVGITGRSRMLPSMSERLRRMARQKSTGMGEQS